MLKNLESTEILDKMLASVQKLDSQIVVIIYTVLFKFIDSYQYWAVVNSEIHRKH